MINDLGAKIYSLYNLATCPRGDVASAFLSNITAGDLARFMDHLEDSVQEEITSLDETIEGLGSADPISIIGQQKLEEKTVLSVKKKEVESLKYLAAVLTMPKSTKEEQLQYENNLNEGIATVLLNRATLYKKKQKFALYCIRRGLPVEQHSFDKHGIAIRGNMRNKRYGSQDATALEKQSLVFNEEGVDEVILTPEEESLLAVYELQDKKAELEAQEKEEAERKKMSVETAIDSLEMATKAEENLIIELENAKKSIQPSLFAKRQVVRRLPLTPEQQLVLAIGLLDTYVKPENKIFYKYITPACRLVNEGMNISSTAKR